MMIPEQKLELDLNLWEEEDREEVQNTLGECYALNGNEHIICYPINTNCHINAYKGYENCRAIIHEYGYADTEAAIEKYVQQFIDDPDNEYIIELGLMSKDNDKYYKNGTYIDENGIDTGEDFYDIHNSGFNVESEYENSWVTVTIFRIVENSPIVLKWDQKNICKEMLWDN